MKVTRGLVANMVCSMQYTCCKFYFSGIQYHSNVTSHLLEIFYRVVSVHRADLILYINGL